MKINLSILLVAMFSISLFGCSEQNVTVSFSGKPGAAEILKLNPNANIFQWEEDIYQTGIDWVNEQKLKEDKQIGEIKFRVLNALKFKNGASNQLPIGAEIYSVKDRNDILIVKYENEVKRYLASSEG